MTAALIKEARRLTWPHDEPHDAERAKVIEALCDALEAAERERDAAKAEVERLRDSLKDAASTLEAAACLAAVVDGPMPTREDLGLAWEELTRATDAAMNALSPLSPPAPEPRR